MSNVYYGLNFLGLNFLIIEKSQNMIKMLLNHALKGSLKFRIPKLVSCDFYCKWKSIFWCWSFWGWIFLGLKNSRNLSVNLVPSKTLLNHPLKGLSLKLLSGIHVKYIVVLRMHRYVVSFLIHFMKLSQAKLIYMVIYLTSHLSSNDTLNKGQ